MKPRVNEEQYYATSHVIICDDIEKNTTWFKILLVVAVMSREGQDNSNH